MALRRQKRSIPGTILLALFLLVVGFLMAFPLIYTIASSLKPPEEFFIFPPRILVDNPTLKNYVQLGSVLSNMWVPFERYLFNSVFVSIVSTVVYIFIVTLAAYPLSKHNFPGKSSLNSIITLALMFTATVTAIPQYIILSLFGWVDTYQGLIIPSLASTMGVFLCVQYMEVIPQAIIESGRIDGAGEYRIWWNLIMPNIKPVIFTAVIFQFQAVWATTGGNLIFNEALKTLPSAMGQIASAGIARAGVGSASAILLMIPPVLVFIISQSNVMETMAHSGIKE